MPTVERRENDQLYKEERKGKWPRRRKQEKEGKENRVLSPLCEQKEKRCELIKSDVLKIRRIRVL